jgi:hypothetical protein
VNPTSNALIFACGLFVGVMVLMEVGRRIGLRRLAADIEGARQGVGTVEGAVFGLLGLLIAFTFSGAASRFDDRRHLVVDEAESIGTAWQRLDVLPPDATAKLQELFRQYLDSRLETYRKVPDMDAVAVELNNSARLQQEIWRQAIAATSDATTSPARVLLLPALNQMFDIATSRIEATKMHPPQIVFIMLGGLSLAAGLLAGSGMAGGKSRSWIHMIGFPAVMAVTVYVIMDIEYPRLGLIRIDGADSVLVQLREGMR